MLFFCTWPDRVSFLVDLPDEAQARAAAREHSEGVEPATCKPFDRVFAAEVFLDEDEDGNELLVVEPLEHVADALYLLEEESDDLAEVIPFPSPATAAPPNVCGFELQDGDRVFTCRLEPHDDARHEADDGAGGLVEWDDAG